LRSEAPVATPCFTQSSASAMTGSASKRTSAPS